MRRSFSATVSASPTMRAPVGPRRASNWPRVVGRPAALLADLGEGVGVAGEEVVGGLLVVSATKPMAWMPTLSCSGAWPARLAGFAVEVDEGAEAVRSRRR